MKPLRFGIIGCDTSHVTAFANLLHDPTHAHHVAGGRIVAAYKGGSPDLEVSIGRLEKFTAELRDNHQVKIVDSIAELGAECDVILLESVDGRVHLEQYRQLLEMKLPVFIDKPLTVSSAEAREIANLGVAHGIPTMTASAIRYAQPFQEALNHPEEGPVIGGDFYGPMAFIDKMPGYFWYGIHSVEMLYAAMGAGCREVTAFRDGDHDVIVGRWTDGRIATVRGNRAGNNGFGGTVHRQTKSRAFDISTTPKPYYASLLEEILSFSTGNAPSVTMDESVEVIRFLEAANESALSGKPVCL